MFNKNATIFKSIGLGLVLLFGIVSCEKDFEDIAIDLVDNKAFSVGVDTIEIIAYNKNIISSRVDNNDVRNPTLPLLGIHQDKDFGLMKSALVSQVFLPIIGVNFGDNAIIDQIVVDIPYYSTRDGSQDAIDQDTGEIINDDEGNPIQVPNFTLDSIYGNIDKAYTLKIYELGTFLNTLDPQDPSKRMRYYSDKDFDIKDQLSSDEFLSNRNDTVLYVERRYLDDDPSTVDDIDTVKAEDLSPSIKLFLDSDFFKTRFVDHQDSPDFDSNSNFTHYFRGLYVDADGSDGSTMNLSMRGANMTIYYTNEIIKDEAADEDLNNNGIEGEQDVAVKTKQRMIFSLGGVRAAKYTRDYNVPEIKEALEFPNMTDGEEKLYVQGAAGSETIIDFFPNLDDLDELRNKDWMINEANLTVYLEENQKEVPTKLFLYNYDYGSKITDQYSFNFGPEVFGGLLEYDGDGEPEKYKFRITKYIMDLLDSDNPKAPSKLALKNYVSSDGFDPQAIDTLTTDFNWIPKGVVLKGNLPKTDKKRIKLEIYYSKSKIK